MIDLIRIHYCRWNASLFILGYGLSAEGAAVAVAGRAVVSVFMLALVDTQASTEDTDTSACFWVFFARPTARSALRPQP